MDSKKIILIIMLMFALLFTVTIFVIKLNPKMHPTILIEKLIIKTRVQNNVK